MARYTPEFVAGVRHDYENTDKSLAQIAVDHAISERTVNRWRDRDGWARRSERVRDVPPAMRAMQEATALLAARPPSSPLPERGRTASEASQVGVRACGEVGLDTCGDAEVSARGESNPSPALRADPPLSGEGKEVAASAASAAPSAIDRIERLVEKELVAEEVLRAQLGPLPRPPADAERSARTLSILTQTLHAIARLRSGQAGSGLDDDDDTPRDIDEFRRDLARRIDAFVASRSHPRHAEGNSELKKMDEAG